MKNIRLILLTAILLISAAGYFIFRDNFSTVRTEERDFAIEDTAAVTKIFLADRNNNAITLERNTTGQWLLNGKQKTRQQGVDFILDCLKKIRVQTRVPKNMYNTVIKELSTTGIKMEVYINKEEKPVKVYFIGGSTQDVLGTYMMLENSSVPFVTEVPGFNGYLTPRFSPVERDWVIREMFNLQPHEIKSVSLEYAVQPEKSFMIERTGSAFRVTSPFTNEEKKAPDTLRISNYLAGFRELNFETWDRFLDDRQTDSLRNLAPLSLLTVVEVSGKKTSIPMYLKAVSSASMAMADSTDTDSKYDVDRMYAFIDEGKELVTIQYFVFNRVFAVLSDFDQNATRRKLRQ